MTVRFKNELVRNITIKLGYANAKVCASVLLLADTGSSNLQSRSINAKTTLALVRVVIDPTLPRKKTTHRASVLDVAIK